jgi:tetratricopeptide (TPR) repeat protein
MWAELQGNLGNALSAQGEMSGDPKLVEEAISCFERLLQACTKVEAPQLWAGTQMNLGGALTTLAQIIGNVDHLTEAVQRYRLALEVFTEGDLAWATVQNNLALALLTKSEFTHDAEFAAEAVIACDRALKVSSKEKTPDLWAMIQGNLGAALLTRGNEVEHDPQLLSAAVEAFRRALEVYTEVRHPEKWSSVQYHLGLTLLAQGRDDPRSLAEAAESFSAALQVCTKMEMPRPWAMTQGNLGNTLLCQDKFAEAVEAFRRALEVFKPERTALDYMRTARSLTQALLRGRAWQEASKELESLMSAGSTLVFAEESRQRQQTLIERLALVGDDLAIARLNLGQPNKAGAVAALGQGRGIVLNLMAALTGLGNRPELQKARVELRIAQSRTDKAEERERAAPTDELAEVHAAAVARTAVHEAYQHFREVVREADLDQPQPVDIAELANAIPAGGALVMLVIPSHGEGWALTLTAGWREPETLPLPNLTRDWLRDQLRAWFLGYEALHKAYAAFNNSAEAAVANDYRNDGAIELWNEAILAWDRVMATVLFETGRVLIKPIDDFLKDKLGLAVGRAEVVLMLPGRLSVLPLHAAPVNDMGDTFLDHWIISQIAAPRMLLTAHRARGRGEGTPSLLGITDPRGDLGLAKNPAAKPEWFADDQREDLVGEKAQMEKAKNKLPLYTHACYYGHAQWNPHAPEQSGLELADGTLTVGGLRELDFGISRFAMLAGCETALLDVRRIPDEFTNLPIALAESGVPCVAASLYPVPIEPTRAMVEGVFRYHIEKGMMPPAALRAAQLDLRGKGWRFPLRGALGAASPQRAGQRQDRPAVSADEPITQEPKLFNWAGFTCYGL